MKKVCNSQRELLQVIREWHQKQVANLNLVTEHKDADLDFGNGLVIKAGTDKAKGFRVGVMIALHYLGTLPTAEYINAGNLDDEESCDE
ncbi:hypothetical protein [Citrobacter braakii]|uniref:hypothetical protein n=1 Tax=Citrobacter braakii TaxID=57706 RepID=UPI00403A41F9